ncbi:MAG: chemotaxis protein CheA [Magnetococcales bacterium]|nr:chemotaxis protein CheA [Magnetococcales bacterium]
MEIDTSAFTEEAYELLSELEDSLLELEEAPEDEDLIGRVFRAMHTIKGSGAMFGFDDIAEFTHEVETVFDMVRGGSIPVTKTLIDLTLAARDQIRSMLDASAGGDPPDEAKAQTIITGLRALVPGGGGGGDEGSANAQVTTPDTQQTGGGKADDKATTFRITLAPSEDIFANGTNPVLLLYELQDLGPCNVVARLGDLPHFEELDFEKCYTRWDIILSTNEGENAIRDVFIFVEDECEIDIRVIDDDDSFDDETPKKLGEILIERGDIKPEQLDQVLHAQAPLGERLVQAGVVGAEKVKSALVEQKVVQEKRDNRKKASASTSLRVPSEKLDVLVDLVGELVTVQARLTQTSISTHDHDLQLIAEEVERLTGELRDNTMSIRMLAIGTTFNKFRRLVRDLSKELGKEIEMTTAGADTELDKTVIDQLNDPLIHIIRNSIDHGVEPPDVREAANKPRVGKVHLSAEHSGASVLIKVMDDGKGLDAALLKRKAIEKGQLPADAELSDKECYMLIFGAGFSMAEKITNVSGRGVGMDVVRKSIDALRGSIDVQSEIGVGTTITLKLPLTLAIIEGLLVKVGDESFILPLAAVEECVELTRKDVSDTHGRHVINVRDVIVPYIRIRDRFEVKGNSPEVEQIVIAEVNERRVGFVVDHVIGQHQTVIKSLGKNFEHSDEFSGATILGDGSVALILDLQRMVQFVQVEEVDELNAGQP